MASSCVQFSPAIRGAVLQRDAYKQLVQIVSLSDGRLNADDLLLWYLMYSAHSACFGDPPSPMSHVSLRDAEEGTVEELKEHSFVKYKSTVLGTRDELSLDVMP